jgi:hypothetical protein
MGIIGATRWQLKHKHTYIQNLPPVLYDTVQDVARNPLLSRAPRARCILSCSSR